MPESYSWDKFQENVKTLAKEQSWLDANTMFALARNAATPDEAVAMAEQLRKANKNRMSMSMAGFMDDGRLYKRPTLGLQLHRFLTSDIGELPIAENSVTDLQQRLIDQGFASEDLRANGVWGKPWQDAMSEYTRYAYERRSKGDKPGALSVNGVLHFMAGMFPTLAYEATIGAVKAFPSDLRHLVGNALTGVEMMGGAARLGWNVATGHETFDQALADELRSSIETKATLTGMSPKEAAADWGLTNAHRMGLPQPGGMMAKPGDTSGLKYGVALEPGVEDMKFDAWKAIQGNLRDLGTAFMVYSVAKTGAETWRSVSRAAAESGSDIAYARGRAATQKAPGVIARKVFRRPEIRVPVRELPGVAERVAAAEAQRDAVAAAARGGIFMPQTFEPNGIARTMAFLNDPLLAETVPVAPGRFGYYAARTALAKPYQNAAVREVGNLFQQGLKTGAQARVVGNIESLGPGNSELLQQIHDTDVLRNFNKNVLGKYGIDTGLKLNGAPLRLSPSLDDLMLFIHAPISPGARTAALGTQVERNSSEWMARANRFFRERSMVQTWDRAMRSAGLRGGYDELIQTIANQLDEIGVDSTMAQDYARDFILMKHDMYVRTRYAEEQIANEFRDMVRTGEIGNLGPDDLDRYTRGTELYHSNVQERVRDLAGDQAARLEAHNSVMDGFDSEDFVNYIVNDAEHTAYAGRGRGADNLDAVNPGVAYSGQVGRYVHAVHAMRNDILPSVTAHLNDVLFEAGLIQDHYADLEGIMQGLGDTGAQLQADVTRAERVLDAHTLPEREQLQASLDGARDTAQRARDSHDGNLARQATRHERRLRRLTGLLNADRAVIGTKRTLLDQARNAREAFEREVINANIREAGWQKRAELLGVNADELTAEFERIKTERMAAAKQAGKKWTGRDSQKIAQEISRKYLDADKTLADLQAAEQRAEDALARAHGRLNDRIAEHGVTYRPRARRQNRFEFPEELTQFEPTPKPELVQRVADAEAEVQRLQSVVDAGPDLGQAQYADAVDRLNAARRALDNHETYRAATQEALDRLGIRIQLDTAENFNPANWGLARNEIATRNTVLRRVEEIRTRYRDLVAELNTGGPERPQPVDEFDLMALDQMTEAQRTALRNPQDRAALVDQAAQDVRTARRNLDRGFRARDAAAPGQARTAAENALEGLRDELGRAETHQRRVQDAARAVDLQNEYDRLLAEYEAYNRDRPAALDPIIHDEINMQIYQLAHDEFGVAADTMRAAFSGRFRHETMVQFIQNRRREMGFGPMDRLPDGLLDQWHREFAQQFSDETERLLGYLEHRASNLAGDVMLDPRVAPQSLIDAQSRLNDLGYKMVYGENMGSQMQSHVAPHLVSWDRRGRVANMIAKLGIKPFVPVGNTTVAEAQKAGRLKNYRELLSRDPSMRAPGRDAKLLDRMITDFNAGVHRDLGHDPGTSLRKLSLGIGRSITGDWRGSKLLGPFAMRERQILNGLAEAGADANTAAEVMQREWDSVSAILRATQHRDIDRRSFVKFFMDRNVWQQYLPDASKEFARPLTKAQAERLYRAMVRGYANAPLEQAGWAQTDNIIRAATTWIGGNWTHDMRVPFTRNMTLPVSAGAQQMFGGAVVGGVAGAAYGAVAEDDMGSWARDVAIGAGIGATSTRGLGVAANAEAQWALGVQGALANSSNAVRTAMTDLRFGLSPMFSLRRISKTNYKMGLEGIDPTFRPLQRLQETGLREFADTEGIRLKDLMSDDRLRRVAQRRADQQLAAEGIAAPSEGQRVVRTNRIFENLRMGRDVAGERAIREGRRLVREAFPEFNATALEYADDAERMLREQDVFQLYNGSSYEAYAAYQMGQRGMTTEQIRERLIHMFQYGSGETVGRSAFERSANFVFFPWSFDKTLYRNTGVYLLNHPGQMAAVVAGLGAYKQFSEAYPDTPGAAEWVQKHLPLLQEVEKLNAFGHGLSAGELGGINAPLLQLFIPHKWASTDESVDKLRRFLPIMKDFEHVMQSVKDQAYVMANAAHNIRAGYVGGDKEMRKLYDTWANPAVSTAPPSQQLSDAYQFQAQMYKYWQEDLAYNSRSRDPNNKYRFPMEPRYGRYAGEIIDKQAIRSMVRDKYPAFDPAGATKFMAQGQQEIYDYRLQLNEGKRGELSQWIKNFAAQSATLATYMNNAEEGKYPAGITAMQANEEFARKTQELRDAALWLAERDPDFVNIYRKHFQRVLGPLEQIATVRGQVK